MNNTQYFSNDSDDYNTILIALEDSLEEAFDEFEKLKEISPDKLPKSISHIDFSLFLKRSALMLLDDASFSYLSFFQKDELKSLINDIAPGYKPLMSAIERNDTRGVIFLLENGANPNQGTEPWFPLLQADQQGDKEIVEILEEYGADWDLCLKVYAHWEKNGYKRKT